MWTRAELKEKAKAMMKHSYWMMFSVSLVAYLLTDAFADILDMLSEQHLLPLRGGDRRCPQRRLPALRQGHDLHEYALQRLRGDLHVPAPPHRPA